MQPCVVAGRVASAAAARRRGCRRPMSFSWCMLAAVPGSRTTRTSAPSCIVHSLLARTARSPPRFDGRSRTDKETASNKNHLMQPYAGEPCVEAEQRGGILDVLVVVAVVAVDVMRNLRSGVAGRQTANVVIMKSPKGTTPSELSGSERSGKGHARTASMRGVLLFLQRQHNTPGGGISI